MSERLFTDGASLIASGALKAGVDFFAGYPITPASSIYSAMVRAGVAVSAPDEITVMQYLTGASINGRRAMTATSGPGYLLMAEGIGAALAMEIPLTVVLVQRLGPATGSATKNAQGDVLMAEHIISGGFPLPVLCPSSLEDCHEMAFHTVNCAEALRTPAVLLTEKDMVLRKRSVDPSLLREPDILHRRRHAGPPEQFLPYGSLDDRGVPAFMPLDGSHVQVRYTASTHDEKAILRNFSETVRSVTERLFTKGDLSMFPESVKSLSPGAEILIVSYGFTCYAARAAAALLTRSGTAASFLGIRTLFPVLRDDLGSALSDVKSVFIVEENHTGLYRKALLAEGLFGGCAVHSIAAMGRTLTSAEIAAVINGKEAGRL
jgi:2-oxoglutarate ferredoxin oxidoreductase subunit alpha